MFSEKNIALYVCTLCLKTPAGEEVSREEVLSSLKSLAVSLSRPEKNQKEKVLLKEVRGDGDGC